MEYTLLLQKIESHYKNQLPFILYSLPDSNRVIVYLQKDSTLYETMDFTEKSVVFAPFDYKEVAICIPAEHSELFEIEYDKKSFPDSEIKITEDEEEKERYIKMVQKARNTILLQNANKIVVSRKKKIPIPDFDLSNLIESLLNTHPSAFRYVWYHPNTGLWCGATPEILVETDGVSFSTMALAGTQVYSKNTSDYWSPKEIEEQKLVTDVITNNLQNITSVLKISKTYNQRAGTLVHLRTDIKGILKKGKATLATISSSLHPTPAVCGTPKKNAKNFIHENEEYDREYYTGFIGPIHKEDAVSQLFVNLRCMKIEKNTAWLYVGGGITGGSVPIDEWEETKNKLHTMLQVLQPVLK